MKCPLTNDYSAIAHEPDGHVLWQHWVRTLHNEGAGRHLVYVYLGAMLISTPPPVCLCMCMHISSMVDCPNKESAMTACS